MMTNDIKIKLNQAEFLNYFTFFTHKKTARQRRAAAFYA